MRRVLVAAGLAAVALVAPATARASGPVPWCGTDSSAADRLPDETPGFAVHVVYAFPADGPDRFAEWAPRIAGDIAELDAWWRAQDPTRAPRFDLAPFPCASTFGRLDISDVRLADTTATLTPFATVFARVTGALPRPPFGFASTEKKYLVYFDGPHDQVGGAQTCGQGRRGYPDGGPESYAVVYVRTCNMEVDDGFRAFVATHELLHALDALPPSGPPHACPGDDAHPCDSVADVLTASNTYESGRLAEKVLDSGRDDYYGHSGPWWDVQDSLFLEHLDGADRTPPSAVADLTATGEGPVVTLRWGVASDDSSVVTYRVYRDGELLQSGDSTPTATDGTALAGRTYAYDVRAADAVGHLGPVTTVRFTVGLGIVDASGRLVRDTVPPGAIPTLRVDRKGNVVRLRWGSAHDAGGLRGYRITVDGRVVATSKTTSIMVTRSKLVGRRVEIVAVDRAGNVGPRLVVPKRWFIARGAGPILIQSR